MRAFTASSSRISQAWNSYGRPSTARRAQVMTVAPCSAKTELMPAPTPRTPPVTKTTRPANPKLMVLAASARVTVLAYQASACLGSRSQGSAMTITSTNTEPGIVAVTVDYPPVNAIPSQGWFELADAITAAGADPDTHAVILRAEGRGFNAGVDIKEMQRTQASQGYTALIDANRGCFAAFRAVYECAVPVIAAVNGFCVGGGIGLVGNSDVIVASDDATFGLPEVERGALGAATHLSRLVPQHMMRRLFFTAATVDAATLHHFGSMHEVVPREQLDEAALRVARDIAVKDTRVIRAAKEALNLIDVQRVNSSYRMEQGFTFELNLAGVSDEHRDAFAGTAKGKKA